MTQGTTRRSHTRKGRRRTRRRIPGLVRDLSADFPGLADLARRVGDMGIVPKEMPEERRAMRALVDEACQQIAPMPPAEQLRLYVRLGVRMEAQARRDYAENVLRQRWPQLTNEQLRLVLGAVDKNLRQNQPGMPRGQLLDEQECITIEHLATSTAIAQLGRALPKEAAHGP